MPFRIDFYREEMVIQAVRGFWMYEYLFTEFGGAIWRYDYLLLELEGTPRPHKYWVSDFRVSERCKEMVIHADEEMNADECMTISSQLR